MGKFLLLWTCPWKASPIPPPKPVPTEESTQAERVGESVPISAEIPTPQKEVTPTDASPFVVLSQAIKDGSSLVVTPSLGL